MSLKPRIERPTVQHVRREREGMSAKHLENVRELPCLVCMKEPPNEAHHLLRTGEHGMGRKSSDQWAIPICAFHHDARQPGSVHSCGGEDEYFASRAIDARSVARALWTERGNLEAMRRVIFAARQRASLKTTKPGSPR